MIQWITPILELSLSNTIKQLFRVFDVNGKIILEEIKIKQNITFWIAIDPKLGEFSRMKKKGESYWPDQTNLKKTHPYRSHFILSEVLVESQIDNGHPVLSLDIYLSS